MNITGDSLKDLGLTYSIDQNEKNGNIHSFELVKGGKEILVTDLEDYIKKRIAFMCSQISIFCEEIRKSFSTMI